MSIRNPALPNRVLFLIVLFSAALAADENKVRALYERKDWSGVVAATESTATQTAELLYLRGMALTELKRVKEARESFLAGRLLAPHDSRFPVELAGIAYLEKDRATAKQYLHAAERLAPADEYINDFLALLYLLEGNTEAALKYWNRIGKPRVRDVRADQTLRTDGTLLRRAIAFSDRSVLKRDEWLKSIANLNRLNTFAASRLEMVPAGSGEYDVTLTAVERGGSARGVARVLPFLRWLPYQAVHLDFINMGGTARSITSMWRWDAQKRRFYSALAGPLHGNPSTRYRVFFDGRRENWDVSRTYRAAPVQGDFVMDTAELGAELETGLTGRVVWKNAVSLSRREFRGNVPSQSSLFTDATLLYQRSSLSWQFLRIPEHRLVFEASASETIGRNFALGRFGKVGGSLRATWLPQASGDDLVFESHLQTGHLFGSVPFDQLFILGMERDNDLWIRGHVGTRDGKKGNAPLGDSFLLSQTHVLKTVYRHPLFRVQLGPFFDTGTAGAHVGQFGTGRWLADTGVEVRLRLAGVVTAVLTYGRDLRSGRGVFYSNVIR